MSQATTLPSVRDGIREVTPSEYEQLLEEDRVRRGVVGFIVKVLPLLAAFWLGWQALVAQGIEPIVAFLLAGAVVAIIYVLLGEIEKHIYEGGSYLSSTRYMAPLLILIMISVAANLTVVYRKFAGPALLLEELDQKKVQLGKAKALAQSALNVEEVVQKRAQINGLLDKVLSELSSPGKPGHGRLVEAALRDLELALGVKLNRHAGSALQGNSSIDVLERRYRQDVSVQLENLPLIASKKGQFEAARVYIERIDKLTPKLETAQSDLRAKGSASELDAIATLSEATTLLESINASAAILGLPKGSLGFDIQFENEGFGTIKHTLQSVSAHLHWPVTWLSIGLALAIDLSALLLVLVMTKPRALLLPGYRIKSIVANLTGKMDESQRAKTPPMADEHLNKGTSSGSFGATAGGGKPAVRRPRPGYIPDLPY